MEEWNKESCKFTTWYFRGRPYTSSEDIRELAIKLFVKCGYLPEDKLDAFQFKLFIKSYPELVEPIRTAMRYRLWSQRYRYQSENSDDGQQIDKKSTVASSHFSKQSILDLSHFVKDRKAKESASSLSNNIYNKSKSVYIIKEPETGPIDFYTSIKKPLKSGFLMKSRGECGDFIKRYYFLKNNLLYYYGLNKKKLVRRIRAGIIFVPDKLLEKFEKDGVYFIRFYNASDRSIRMELAAETQEERDQWFKALSRAWENIEKWVDFKDVIGTGQFASVRKAYSKDSSQVYAVKIISKSDPQNYDRDSMIKELKILSVINHPNIPKIYGVYETIDKMYIFMENIEHGSLFDHLKTKFHLDQKEAGGIAYEILDIVRYLNELKIMHRDIKPENILVDKNEEGKVIKSYLIDYGLSTFYDYSEYETQMWGTIGYVAPEVFLDNGYNHAIDVWSIATVLYFLVTGELPFEDKDDYKIVQYTISNSFRYPSSLFSELSINLPDLLTKMTLKDVQKRSSVEEAMNHQFFEEICLD